jgi:CRP/FNR family transcriptional regulator, cyclic AMP receptor protein
MRRGPSPSDIRPISAGPEAVRAARSRGFLARLSPDFVEEITQGGTAIYYPQGSVSFPSHEGANPAVVVSGMLRYLLSTAGGRQITIRYIGVGDLVGTVVPRGSGLSTTFQAVEPSVLLHLDRVRMQAAVGDRPEFAWELVEEMAIRLRFAYSALAATAFTSVRARVARDLVERARAGGRLETGALLPVTQQALADATGSVREVVARAIRELRTAGVITTDADGIRIKNLQRLEAEAANGAGD